MLLEIERKFWDFLYYKYTSEGTAAFQLAHSRLAANADKKINASGGIDGFRKLENVVKF